MSKQTDVWYLHIPAVRASVVSQLTLAYLANNPHADHDREMAFCGAAADHPLNRFDRRPDYHGPLTARDITGLLNMLSAAEVDLVGHSLGGPVACQ
jgi:pimeloyl-ACP methyl ester carboxylesterase